MPEPEIIIAPICCGAIGALTGLTISFCIPSHLINSCLPIIIGSGLGGGLGCICCLRNWYLECKYPAIIENETITIRNIYLDNQVGQGK